MSKAKSKNDQRKFNDKATPACRKANKSEQKSKDKIEG